MFARKARRPGSDEHPNSYPLLFAAASKERETCPPKTKDYPMTCSTPFSGT